VKKREFREDLYYRLCVVPIEIPPLRQRREDILILAEHFLERFARKFGSNVAGFSRAALAKLTRLPWAGNVRELENTVERAVIFCEGNLVDEQDIQVTDVSEPAAQATQLFTGLKTLHDVEREYIEYVLTQTSQNREKAAEILGINRKTLYRRRKEMQAGKAGGGA
jgi:DNA-binding NtrC family response regulator